MKAGTFYLHKNSKIEEKIKFCVSILSLGVLELCFIKKKHVNLVTCAYFVIVILLVPEYVHMYMRQH